MKDRSRPKCWKQVYCGGRILLTDNTFYMAITIREMYDIIASVLIQSGADQTPCMYEDASVFKL